MPSKSTPRSEARAWVEVDLGAVARNARALAAHAKAPLIPMVKADAYGLGAVRVARALEPLDPLAFGVSSVPEAAELRAAGFTRPIILFTPGVLDAAHPQWTSRDLPELLEHGITPTLANARDIEAWGARAHGRDWHLAIDTGMHRAGADHAAVADLADVMRRVPPKGAFTHFHSAELDDGSMEAQEERFRAAIAALPVRPRLLHAENSAGIVRRGPSSWNAVRPGIFLYGVGSGPTAPLQPEPVVGLRARILELRDVAPGEGVSYDATWRVPADGRPARVATVACGYADGLRRHLGNRAHGLVHGRPAPIRGVVTMDMAMVDVTDIPCAVGDVVTFLGRDGDALLTAAEVAEAGGLSPYELLVGLKLRLPRVYHEA